MGVQTGDVILIGHSHRLLSLYQFKVVSYSSSKAVLRLLQLLVGQVQRAGSDINFIGSGLYVKERGAQIIFDLSAQVVQFPLTLFQSCVGLNDVAARLTALKDRDFQAAGNRESSIRFVGVRTDHAIVRIQT